MKSLLKILSRYVLSAAGAALILLVINFAVLATWTVQAGRIAQKGLGLTIVRQIIKAHAGTTEFRNLPGSGCAVVLYLPVFTADEADRDY